MYWLHNASSVAMLKRQTAEVLFLGRVLLRVYVWGQGAGFKQLPVHSRVTPGSSDLVLNPDQV